MTTAFSVARGVGKRQEMIPVPNGVKLSRKLLCQQLLS
jgi:hypothetical protein